MTEVEKKRCENCKKLFGRKMLANGKLEYPSSFAAKRFCSKACVAIWVEEWKKLKRDAERA